MEPVQSVESEKKARAARDAALGYRSAVAPLPEAIAWPVDTEPYRRAAQKYYEAAQQSYQTGDHERGDYCILRGDTYLLLISLATQVRLSGMAPLLEAKPAEPAEEAGRSSKAKRKKKLQKLQDYLDRKGGTLSILPDEAANDDPCGYFHDMSLKTFGYAIDASDVGNDAGVDYWLHESLLWDISEGICQEKLTKVPSLD